MDPFATLGIPRAFDIDVDAAERAHRELSRALHPDKFVAGGASERRAALGKAVEVNEAWRVVRDPIRRAEALLSLAGVVLGEGHEPKAETGFLMEMLEQGKRSARRRPRAIWRRFASWRPPSRSAAETLSTRWPRASRGERPRHSSER